MSVGAQDIEHNDVDDVDVVDDVDDVGAILEGVRQEGDWDSFRQALNDVYQEAVKTQVLSEQADLKPVNGSLGGQSLPDGYLIMAARLKRLADESEGPEEYAENLDRVASSSLSKLEDIPVVGEVAAYLAGVRESGKRYMAREVLSDAERAYSSE